MAQIEEDVVKQALAEAGGNGDAAAGLRPDEIDRVKAAFAEPDLDQRVAKVNALLDELEAAAAGQERQLAEIQRSFGLQPGMTAAFLKSGRLGSNGEREIAQAMEASAAQFADSARREARQALSGPKTARPPRAGRISI
jgi:hypothetical protein